MAWTTPRTWSVAEKVTAAIMNAHVKANLDWLGTPPSCRVTASSVANVTTSTWTLVAFDGETYDTAVMHDNSTNNSRLVAPVAGKYQLTVSAAWALSASGTRALMVRKNSAGAFGSGTILSQSNVEGTGVPTAYTLTDSYSLAANDYIEVFRYQDSGGNLAPYDLGAGYPAYATLRFIGF